MFLYSQKSSNYTSHRHAHKPTKILQKFSENSQKNLKSCHIWVDKKEKLWYFVVEPRGYKKN